MPTNNRPNNRHLQALFDLSSIQDAGDPVAQAIDDLLATVEKNGKATDDDWSRILLHVADVRRQLSLIENHVLKARAQPALTFDYDEAERLQNEKWEREQRKKPATS